MCRLNGIIATSDERTPPPAKRIQRPEITTREDSLEPAKW